ncbi:unnamed protein product [Closterium sp. Yama58-4]|nr:unnamed protein product [Closterium sp. Yama58-4]
MAATISSHSLSGIKSTPAAKQTQLQRQLQTASRVSLAPVSISAPRFAAGFQGRWSASGGATTRALAVDAQLEGAAAPAAEATERPVMLEVKGLKAVIAESGKEILHGVDLCIREGEVHAIMGKNGSGKSTLSKVLVGHPDYEITGGSVTYRGEDLLELEPEERSHAGVFLSFQSPVELPGVNNVDFLRLSCNARRAAKGLPEMEPLEFYGFLSPKLEELNMDLKYLQRNVNEGFSGGEKKRNEILQLAVLDAELAILDEIDSGLDVDALRDVATAVNSLKRPDKAVLMITHYQRLLDYIRPDYIHIMEQGRIVLTGDASLASQLEEKGYAGIQS